jgi:hypothetical protein
MRGGAPGPRHPPSVSPVAALIAWVIVASAGAVVIILAQRVFWHAHA